MMTTASMLMLLALVNKSNFNYGIIVLIAIILLLLFVGWRFYQYKAYITDTSEEEQEEVAADRSRIITDVVKHLYFYHKWSIEEDSLNLDATTDINDITILSLIQKNIEYKILFNWHARKMTITQINFNGVTTQRTKTFKYAHETFNYSKIFKFIGKAERELATSATTALCVKQACVAMIFFHSYLAAYENTMTDVDKQAFQVSCEHITHLLEEYFPEELYTTYKETKEQLKEGDK